jgi:hypothetical protein
MLYIRRLNGGSDRKVVHVAYVVGPVLELMVKVD